jgi:hypothetical protein
MKPIIVSFLIIGLFACTTLGSIQEATIISTHATAIKNELEKYSKDYIKSSLDVVTKCELVLNSSQSSATSLSSEANDAIWKLRSNFPDFRDSALDKALAELVSNTSFVAVPMRGVMQRAQSEMALNAKNLIFTIRKSLGQ